MKMAQRFQGLILMLLLAILNTGLMTLCVPNELVLNGGFDTQVFVLAANESEILISKSKKKLAVPHWTVTNGSVQVASSTYYYPDSATRNGVGNYCVHMNSGEGPGTITSAPLIGQIAGAVYNFSISIAGSPQGGELYKKMQIILLFRRKWFSWWFVEYKYPQHNATNPFNSRTNIAWRTKLYSFVGTGRETRIKIISKSAGSKGFLIDNVHVSLHSILDNGSFEQLVNDATSVNVFLDSDIVNSPSWKIRKWFLEAGSVKYIRGRLQPSTDNSGSTLDLNGDSPGLLSCNVSTINKKYYYISFDHAANPEALKLVKGYFSLNVYSENNDKSVIKKKWVWVTNKGCSSNLVGWKTSTIGFYAKSNITYIKFESTIKGTFGPLLDNVQMYQYITPFSAATPVVVITCPQLERLLLVVAALLHFLQA